eukprot:CAMPEP_0174727732 /NCGR_PEP_ID=MMETSP1094-20130205/50363_1 /TAXON_ID=156173 /ORGANISM="Chrysochromulina brevifilum, Strain UTEX LB 985" /LENGTH=163 /DNA_ID=CAMNT_0015929539 /DNA_START=40 /DNA_END=531 /DNA_ORIENTATION=-
MCLMQLAAGMRVAAGGRASPPIMMADKTQCALIDLSAEEPKRVAQVLKKAWMEGGVKRGLIGTVFVLDDEQKVQIACQGPPDRLKSFAKWIEESSMLVTNVDIKDPGCVTAPLNNKFPLAEAEAYTGATVGSFSGALAEQLKALSFEIKAKRGKTHSSDEGLA